MKLKIILILLIININNNTFCDDLIELMAEYGSIVRDIVYETINPDYLSNALISGNSSWISISIYFKTDVYEYNEQFNNIIENEILIKLRENIPVDKISIHTIYPFWIILTNENNYTFDEMQIIRENINTYGVVGYITNSSINGYITDRYFGYLSERNNELLFNCFNIYLEKIIEYFGIGNIIIFK